jgi:hypothetical protein
MNKVTLTVPWGEYTMGSYGPHLKKQNKSTVYYNIFSLSNNILQHGLSSHIDKQTRLCLGTLKYIEYDKEIHRKWITKPEEYSTTLHVRFSDYFTYSIIICRYLLITVRYVMHHTLQNLTMFIYYMGGTMGSI